MTAVDIPGMVQRPPSLPEPESRETHQTSRRQLQSTRVKPISPDAQPLPPPPEARPPTEPPPTVQPGFTSPRAVVVAIQIAAFQTRQRAEELRATLQAAGFAAYVVETEVPPGSARYYRVRVGPFDTREEAQRVASNVQSRFPQQIPDYWIVFLLAVQRTREMPRGVCPSSLFPFSIPSVSQLCLQLT